MIYLIGGAPRVGKTILAQDLSARLGIGWISTDLLVDLLRHQGVSNPITGWDASPEAVHATADWFYPILHRFVWGVNSMADQYIVEGVSFLPEHIARLAVDFPVRAVFLGCLSMTPDRFDRFPGRSRGYAGLPEAERRRFAQDVPAWSETIRREAETCGCPYVEMGVDFDAGLAQAAALLVTGKQ